MSDNVNKIETNGFEVAIIGMSGKFPRAENIEAYWNNIKNGVDCISFMSDQDLIEEGISESIIKNKNYIKAKGVLENLECFDNGFFNYTKEEAKFMDPQLRLLHECVYESIEDAGYTSKESDRNIGLFVGNMTNFNWLSNFSGEVTNAVDKLSIGTLNDSNTLSTRISYKLNLKGPSFTVQTACSTSIVSVHLACQSLISGECKIAVAGGVAIDLPKKNGYIYQEGMIYSKDGYCHSFDEEASGSVFGDGIGVVTLKLLEDAIADNDNIYAVIKGSAINNDGSEKPGFLAPSVNGEANVIKKALSAADVKAESISYVETHGTATTLGDPIEIEALKKAFNTKKKNYCAIGTVKTNIGHLNNASGIAGLIKTALCIKNRILPPSLHFNKPNSKIDFDNSPFYVNTEMKEWKNDQYPLRAGVSSFGIGGTNAHLILEEAPIVDEVNKSYDNNLILLSAKSEEALDRMTLNLSDYLKKNKNVKLSSVAYMLARRREIFNVRQSFICHDVEEAVNYLESDKKKKITTSKVKKEIPKLVYMFTGQGCQYINMGLDLYKCEPVYKKYIDSCFDILKEVTSKDLKSILYPGEEEINEELILKPENSQPILFILEYSLVMLLKHYGIEPDIMIGYSFGEYVAACLAGTMELKDSLKLLHIRGELLKKASKGAMLSIPLPEEEVKEMIDENISIAIDNRDSCIVSGTDESICKLENELKEKKYLCMRIDIEYAGHSHLLNAIRDEYESYVKNVKLNNPKIDIVSGITGRLVDNGEITSVEYWGRHLTSTVKFVDGIKEISKNSNNVFIEIGPGNSLSMLAKRIIENNECDHKVINLIRNKANKILDSKYLLEKLGKLWSYGVDVDLDKVFLEQNKISIPTYPFERNYFWPEKVKALSKKKVNKQEEEINKAEDICNWLYCEKWERKRVSKKDIKRNPVFIVFHDEYGIGKDVEEKLKNDGKTVISVYKGKVFNKIVDFNYFIDYNNQDDYCKLFKEIKIIGNDYFSIVNLLSVKNSSDDKDFLELLNEELDLGFYSVLNFAKAIKKTNLHASIDFNLITSNCQYVADSNKINPGRTCGIGAAFVLAQECPFVKSRNIDININKDNSYDKFIINDLLEELESDPTDKCIAYRDGSRWVKGYEHFYPNEYKEVPLKDEGVYYIVGGFGNIGLEIAEYISENKKAKIALSRRREFPEKEEWDRWIDENVADNDTSRIILKLKEIEKNGTEILILQAEASDINDMEKSFRIIEDKWKKVDGVIYTAGIVGEKAFNIIEDVNYDQCREQFRAKISGIVILEEVLKNRKIDFCILSSSLTSILGGLGHIVYCAANTFIDNFIYYHNLYNDNKWNVVNWDFWKFEKGNGIDGDKYVGKTSELLAMKPKEGIRLFEKILCNMHERRVIVSTGSLESRINYWIKFNDKVNTEDDYELKRSHITSYDKITSEVIYIWSTVLGLEDIGLNEDFFELGGDSFKAIKIISNVFNTFKIEVPVKEFYNQPNVSYIVDLIKKEKKIDENKICSKVKNISYNLSSAQKRLFVLNMLDKDSIAYNTSSIMMLNDNINKDKLEKAFRLLINRYEILRTEFKMIDGEISQNINNDINFKLDFSDEADGAVEDIIKDFIQPFDLKKAPLIRAGLFKVKSQNNKYILIIDIHHIIMDGQSLEVFKEELMMLYYGRKLPEVDIQYSEYVYDQEQLLNSPKYLKQESFWLDKFKGELPVLNLPIDYKRKVVRTFYGNKDKFILNEELTYRIKKFAKSKGITLYMFLLSTYNILLSKVSNTNDVIVGSPVLGRNKVKYERIIGLLINTVPIKSHIDYDECFSDYLKEVKDIFIESFENQEYQFDELVDKLNIPKNLNRNPLFDTMFVLQNIDVAKVDKSELNIIPYEYENKTSRFDLSLECAEMDKEIKFKFEYCADLFKLETIKRFEKYYINIIEKVLDNPDIKISQIELMTAEEKLIINEFSKGSNNDYDTKNIVQLFERQVEKTPDNIALVLDEKAMTYFELNEKANQLANYLNDIGIGRNKNNKNEVVTILLDSSFEMIISIIGVLKAGAAYCPLSITNPNDRIKYILDDCGSKVILTYGKILNDNTEILNFIEEREIALVDISETEIFASEDSNNLNHEISENDLAYIIYTSGTTGKPKGVLIEHKGMNNSISWRREEYKLNSEDTILQVFPVYFDGFITSFFTPITSGSKVVLLRNEEIKDVRYMCEKISEHKITHFIIVPALFSAMCEYLTERHLRSVTKITFAGDKASESVIKFVKEIDDSIELINEYGPTESSIVCTVNRKFNIDSSCVIGKPISNTEILILDNYMNLCPVSIEGEIYISGAGLARGYTYISETENKFLKHPFKPNERIYRSGDIGRWLKDGTIEFIGRKDNQVKIRGLRIELKEIENALKDVEGIEDTIVIDIERGNGIKSLCAYVVSSKDINERNIRKELVNVLPEYMIPTYFVFISKIPVNENGKINRRLLPEPLLENSKTENYIEPKSDIEIKISNIVKDVLKLNNVGINDNFFEIGADSISIVYINSKINTEFNVDISIVLMYQYHSISLLIEKFFNDDALEGEDDGINKQEEVEEAFDRIGDIMSLTLEDTI